MSRPRPGGRLGGCLGPDPGGRLGVWLGVSRPRSGGGVQAQAWGVQAQTRGGVPADRHLLQQTATAADGTHPTGMHSCLETSFKIIVFKQIYKARKHHQRRPPPNLINPRMLCNFSYEIKTHSYITHSLVVVIS